MDIGACMTRRSPLFSRGSRHREKKGPTTEGEARWAGDGAGAVSAEVLLPLFTCLSITLLADTHLSDTNTHTVYTCS